jgi:3-oxoacid CoA-transferase subunit A
MISSYVGENKEFERQFLAGELELEFNPQGTLAERCAPAAPASRPSSPRPAYGTIGGRGQGDPRVRRPHYVMERALTADVALVKAWKADRGGNLVFRKTARNFNPMPGDGRQGHVAEVEEIVEIGELDPDHIHLPGIYVHRIVHNPTPEKRIEQRTTAAKSSDRRGANMAWTRDEMAARAAQELRTASTSTSASACRRWWPTTSPRA